MEATSEVWINAMAAVLFISAAPALLLIILPIDHRVEHQMHLKKLLAIAAGCLLGDAFLHLIPQSRENSEAHHDHEHEHHHHDHDHGHNHGHSHGHSHDMSGLKILSGMMVFLIMEKLIYAIKPHLGHDHSHHGVEKAKKKKNDDYKGIQVSGWLNLTADFLHNFTDGLAIGASFLAGNKVGLSTAFAIFLHEVPHEIGDYAILIQSGCTKKKAILLQLVTALGACSGTLLSLYLGSLGDETSSWVLPFTAGGFIYIATVHLIPQLKSSNFRQTIWELAGIVGGVGIMYSIALFE